jgi:hypothetical protein
LRDAVRKQKKVPVPGRGISTWVFCFLGIAAPWGRRVNQ